ncbi:MAG: hypothetical protein NT049_14840 [Planctomycetota bacterium]|nr:hypothetical protein [Planctomycetota bacterium]
MFAFMLRFSLVALAFAAPALAAPEDEALQAFNSLYGEEVKRAQATPDPADDAALAGKLLDAAKSVTGQPSLMAVLCEKAADLGKSSPAGRATAIQAMEFLVQKVPDRKAACLEKLAGLRQAEYDTARPEGRAQAAEALVATLTALADAKIEAGDAPAAAEACRKALALGAGLKPDARAAIQDRMAQLATFQKTDQKVAALKVRLAGDPTSAVTRTELIMTLVVESNNPAAAVPLIDTTVDATLQKFVPAAAKGIDQTPEMACSQLGDWYRGLADQAVGPAKASMIARAKAYYARFLSLHAAEDVARAQVTLAMKKLDEASAVVEPAPADTAAKPAAPSKGGVPAKAPAAAAAAAASDTLAANQWHDLIMYIDTNKDPVFGIIPVGWRREKNNTLVCSNSGYNSNSRLTVPVMPQGSFDLQAKFAITGSTYGYVGFYLPTGTNVVMLRVNCSGPSGLDYINDRTSSSNGTGMPTSLVIGRVYTIDARVTLTGDQASIVATLDGKPLVQWSGPQAALSPYETMDIRCLGLHTYYSTVTIGLLRMRPAQEARLYKPDGKGPMTGRPMIPTRRPPADTTGAAPGGQPAPTP